MQVPNRSTTDAKQVQEQIQRVMQRYPMLFRKLTKWLDEPRLYGSVVIERHGGSKITIEVSRKEQEGGDGSVSPERSPVHML
ncbi:MAG: hypothetical protein U0172_03545 [Nitrospiraceae bacterium]